MTKHYKQLLLPVANSQYGKIMSGNGDHWLQADDEVARLPYYLWLSVTGVNGISDVYGPFIFKNGFEKTKEAEYLRSMLQYEQLTATAAKKVSSILDENSAWVSINQKIVEVGTIHMEWLRNDTRMVYNILPKRSS